MLPTEISSYGKDTIAYLAVTSTPKQKICRVITTLPINIFYDGKSRVSQKNLQPIRTQQNLDTALNEI